jgi:hypothetical protein
MNNIVLVAKEGIKTQCHHMSAPNSDWQRWVNECAPQLSGVVCCQHSGIYCHFHQRMSIILNRVHLSREINYVRADRFSISALVCKRYFWNLKFGSFRAHTKICHDTWKIHFMIKNWAIMCICGCKIYCRNETNSFREKIYACYETAPQRINNQLVNRKLHFPRN